MTTALAKAVSAALARLLRQQGVAFSMEQLASPVDTTGTYWQWPSIASGLREIKRGTPIISTWATSKIPSLPRFMAWYETTVHRLQTRNPAGWDPVKLAYAQTAFHPTSARLFYSQPAGWPYHTDDAAFQFAVEAAYHLRYARDDVELRQTEGGVAAYHQNLPVAGVRREGPVVQGSTLRLGNLSTVQYATESLRGQPVDRIDRSRIAQAKTVILQGLSAAEPDKVAEIEELLNMVRFYYHERVEPVETFLVMLATECAMTSRYLEERDTLRHVIENWEDLGTTDLQRFGQAMLHACPRPLSPTKFSTRVLNIMNQAGQEPTRAQVQRGRQSLRQLLTEHCDHYGLPE